MPEESRVAFAFRPVQIVATRIRAYPGGLFLTVLALNWIRLFGSRADLHHTISVIRTTPGCRAGESTPIRWPDVSATASWSTTPSMAGAPKRRRSSWRGGQLGRLRPREDLLNGGKTVTLWTEVDGQCSCDRRANQLVDLLLRHKSDAASVNVFKLPSTCISLKATQREAGLF